jgi:hypothetical protein
MRKLIVAGLTGLALTAAVPAFAATSSGVIARDYAPMKNDCQGLQKEFDRAEPLARMKSSLPNAEYLRGEGGRLCRAGQYPDGIATMRSALNLLGIQPHTTTGPLEDGAG